MDIPIGRLGKIVLMQFLLISLLTFMASALIIY